jgi:hypothetical protein
MGEYRNQLALKLTQKSLLVVLGLSLYLIPVGSRAGGLDKTSCFGLVRIFIHNLVVKVSGAPTSIQNDHPLTTDLFGVTRVTEGSYGGKRIEVFRRLGWHDPHQDLPDKADLTQDLRLFSELLGAKEAEFFGFEILSHRQARFPDPDELNGAIERFNAGLDPVDTRFISYKAKKIEPGQGTSRTLFLKTFANQGRIVRVKYKKWSIRN